MVVRYRLTAWRRAANSLMRGLLRWGLAPRHTYLLTVLGRRSGRPQATPVTLVEEGQERWLVAPYGEVRLGAERAGGRSGDPDPRPPGRDRGDP
jgi:F420H(2)-dependent quinone reductase